METLVMRVWMQDRPGALGQVASRIGAVGGDLVGIEVLERGGGEVIDELVVCLPDAGLRDLLVSEVHAVDGARIEDLRWVAEPLRDPGLDALETAAVLVAVREPDDLLDALVVHARLDLAADWAAVVAEDVGDDAEVVAADGLAPPAAWLQALCSGRRAGHDDAPPSGGEVACARLASVPLALLVGRTAPPLRARERRRIEALACITDVRWVELVRRRSQQSHPSRVGAP